MPNIFNKTSTNDPSGKSFYLATLLGDFYISYTDLKAAIISGLSSVTTFLGLTDTPASYVGASGKVVRVNSGGNGVDFSSATIDNTGALWLRSTLNDGSALLYATNSDSSPVFLLRANGQVSMYNNAIIYGYLQSSGLYIVSDDINVAEDIWSYYLTVAGAINKDTVNDIRFKNDNGIFRFEKCSVGSITKGGGTWIPLPVYTGLASKTLLGTDSSGNIIERGLTQNKTWVGNASNLPVEKDFYQIQYFDATVGTGGDYATIQLALVAGKKVLKLISNIVETTTWGSSFNFIMFSADNIQKSVTLIAGQGSGANSTFTCYNVNIVLAGGVGGIFSDGKFRFYEPCKITMTGTGYAVFANSSIVWADDLTIVGTAGNSLWATVANANKITINMVGLNSNQNFFIYGVVNEVEQISASSKTSLYILGGIIRSLKSAVQCVITIKDGGIIRKISLTGADSMLAVTGAASVENGNVGAVAMNIGAGNNDIKFRNLNITNSYSIGSSDESTFTFREFYNCSVAGNITFGATGANHNIDSSRFLGNVINNADSLKFEKNNVSGTLTQNADSCKINNNTISGLTTLQAGSTNNVITGNTFNGGTSGFPGTDNEINNNI